MTVNTCGDCVWLVLGPGSRDLGACFDSYAERYNYYDDSSFSYRAVRSTEAACENFKPKEAC